MRIAHYPCRFLGQSKTECLNPCWPLMFITLKKKNTLNEFYSLWRQIPPKPSAHPVVAFELREGASDPPASKTVPWVHSQILYSTHMIRTVFEYSTTLCTVRACFTNCPLVFLCCRVFFMTHPVIVACFYDCLSSRCCSFIGEPQTIKVDSILELQQLIVNRQLFWPSINWFK